MDLSNNVFHVLISAMGEAVVFQHLLRDLAKVNALKNDVSVVVIIA